MIKYVIIFCYKCTTTPDTQKNYKHAVQTKYPLILSRIRCITTFDHMIETKFKVDSPFRIIKGFCLLNDKLIKSVICIHDTLSSRAALGRVRRASKGILHTNQLYTETSV